MQLHNWVQRQRKLLRKVGREGFDPARLAKLDGLGFDFDPMGSEGLRAKMRANLLPKKRAQWEVNFQRLAEFQAAEGNLVVGPRHRADYPGLHDWIHHQRREHKRWAAGDPGASYCDDWAARLAALGFDFAPMSGDRSGFCKMRTSNIRVQSRTRQEAWSECQSSSSSSSSSSLSISMDARIRLCLELWHCCSSPTGGRTWNVLRIYYYYFF